MGIRVPLVSHRTFVFCYYGTDGYTSHGFFSPFKSGNLPHKNIGCIYECSDGERLIASDGVEKECSLKVIVKLLNIIGSWPKPPSVSTQNQQW
jgi:hypothetical protein